MAASNLYPPLLAATLPAFVYSEGIYNIPFTVSQYNSPSQISKWIQISVVNPYTGESALNSKYPNGIVTVPADNSGNYNALTERNNTVRLDGGDLLENPLKQSLSSLTGEYFKIQLRFCSSSISVPSPVSQAWLAENINEFSEWSKATLVRIISKPVFLIQNSKLILNDINYDSYIYTDQLLKLSGKMQLMKQDQNDEPIVDMDIKENLLNYKFDLYQGGRLLETSGFMSAKDNYFSYTFKKKLLDSIGYVIKFTYKTSSGYTNSIFYNLIVQLAKPEKSHIAIVDVSESESRGAVAINILLKYSKDEEIYTKPKILIIKRSDNFSNYEYWETVHYVKIPLSIEEITYNWYDTTINSGVWYQYEVREVYEFEQNSLQPKIFGTPLESDKILINFDDIYLNTTDSLLKIKFDPEITNYKQVVQQSITNTLGSQFPYIRKNGDVNYRQFSLKGLISCAMDEQGIFLNKEKFFGFYNSYYNIWRENNNILSIYELYPHVLNSLVSHLSEDQYPEWKPVYQQQPHTLVQWDSINENGDIVYRTYDNEIDETSTNFYSYLKTQAERTKDSAGYWTNDFIWQRFFRQQVINFLNDGKPKLFRSSTQGNILVYLNNIDFVPNKTLGRTIYEFSAQCTQVAEATIDNLKKYNIIENDLQEVSYRYVLDTQRYDPIGSSVFITKDSVYNNMADSTNNELTIFKCDLGTIDEIITNHTVMANTENNRYPNIINKNSHRATVEANGTIPKTQYQILVSREFLGLNRVGDSI